ncbi:hypothetical protein [uncultured Sulfitobacter sp.]|uniref:hypothetical protein n=1 Tax=uncultured Sulfitobacter sp. TaxID=191468 RepID=UPI0026306E01|nr:hypothetical protein [uncultured Sulfitobacter sp.]
MGRQTGFRRLPSHLEATLPLISLNFRFQAVAAARRVRSLFVSADLQNLRDCAVKSPYFIGNLSSGIFLALYGTSGLKPLFKTAFSSHYKIQAVSLVTVRTVTAFLSGAGIGGVDALGRTQSEHPVGWR